MGPRQVVCVPRCIHIAVAAPQAGLARVVRAGRDGLFRQFHSVVSNVTDCPLVCRVERNEISPMKKAVLISPLAEFCKERSLLLFKLE